MIGTNLGHYRLTAKIGEGGMGVVYRARDEELNRDVAVKVLAAGTLEQAGKDQLLREAQIASALNHPNICTIYQIGRVDDGFYAMPPLKRFCPSIKTTVLLTAGSGRLGPEEALVDLGRRSNFTRAFRLRVGAIAADEVHFRIPGPLRSMAGRPAAGPLEDL